MNANEYQKLAMRTKSKNFTNKELMINAALGLAGEITEYALEKNDINKELGDIQWYIALMCEVCELDFEDILEIARTKEIDISINKYGENHKKFLLTLNSGVICDYVKKIYFQGHELDKYKIAGILVIIQKIILDICDDDLEEIWKLNIDKLKKRYPDGFKVQDSVNRTE